MGSDNLSASYAAVVDYHNGLVQMRFTVAGLYLAANALLASGFFQSSTSLSPWFILPALGVSFAVVCYLLELRTYQLLKNLGARGQHLEETLGIDDGDGFFSLMESQPIGARLLPSHVTLPTNKFFKFVVSHSFGLGMLYAIVALFWVGILLLHK